MHGLVLSVVYGGLSKRIKNLLFYLRIAGQKVFRVVVVVVVVVLLLLLLLRKDF